MNQKIKIILVVLLLLALAGGYTAYYMYNKPHRNIAEEKAEFILTATKLIEEFTNDEAMANQKYLDKVLLVSGKLVEKNHSETGYTILFEDEFEGVSATFDSLYAAQNKAMLDAYTNGDQVQVKGKCDGMLMLQGVILSKCVVE
ncbi:MAG: OB-fold putative lipoprotein [Bacteroidales bacterium]|nr:OB-fold putative lipoprotein [Bacteroidales bacterium]MCF8459000.1 OB-fold putative lipoprotein [Bacteroidales bacterium]